MEELKENLAVNPEKEKTTTNERIVPTSEWIITMLIMIVPLINIIMLFVWGFGNNTSASKANWAKASLIWVAISIFAGIIMTFLFGGLAYLGIMEGLKC